MKTRLMTSVAVATLGAFKVTSADAADLPAYVPPPPEPAWSWTGPYAGVHAGTVDGDVEGDFELFFNGKFQGEEEAEFDPNGIMGGVQAGYNFQFDSIVLGIEGDVSFGDVDDVLYPTLTDPGGATTPLRVEPQIDWMATIRGRLGWARDRTLFYATGGVAFTDLEIEIDAEGFGSGSDKNSYFGWTVGGGVEHAWTDNISFKAEYLYADFGKESYSVTDFEESDVGTRLEIGGDAKLRTHTFRVGVNWLF